MVVLGHHAHGHGLWEKQSVRNLHGIPGRPPTPATPGLRTGQQDRQALGGGPLGVGSCLRPPLHSDTAGLADSTGFHTGLSSKKKIPWDGLNVGSWATLPKGSKSRRARVCLPRTRLWACRTQNNADGVSPRRLLTFQREVLGGRAPPAPPVLGGGSVLCLSLLGRADHQVGHVAAVE